MTNTLEPLTTNGELPNRSKKTKLTNSIGKSKSPYIDENVNLVNMSRKSPKATTPTKTDVLRIEGGNNHKDNDNDLVELKRASHEINRSNRRIIKQTFVSDVLEIPDIQTATTTTATTTTKTTKHKSKTKKSDSLRTKEKNNKNSEFVPCDPETDDWDTMFDDNGECLDPKIIEELSASVGNVKIVAPKMDYTVSWLTTIVHG